MTMTISRIHKLGQVLAPLAVVAAARP